MIAGKNQAALAVCAQTEVIFPFKSLLPKFGPVDNGAKRKVTFDVRDVTLCYHSDISAIFLPCRLEMIRNCKNLKGIRP